MLFQCCPSGYHPLLPLLFLFVGMLLASQLMPLLSSPVMAPAFKNLMPAIMGALLVPRIKSDPVLASVPCLLAAVVTLILGYATVSALQTYLLPAFLLVAVGWAYFLYKQRQKKQPNPPREEQSAVVAPGEKPTE